MVPTASASPVTEASTALNETSLAIHITPSIPTNFINSTLKEWPSRVAIPGFDNARLEFHYLGARGAFEQTAALLHILQNSVKQWKLEAGMSI